VKVVEFLIRIIQFKQYNKMKDLLGFLIGILVGAFIIVFSCNTSSFFVESEARFQLKKTIEMQNDSINHLNDSIKKLNYQHEQDSIYITDIENHIDVE
jgi:hypothetical protein